MAIDDAERSDSPALEGESESGDSPDGVPARVGEYTWAEFMAEHGHGDEVGTVYEGSPTPPMPGAWGDVSFDPSSHLGFHPSQLPDRLGRGGVAASTLKDAIDASSPGVDGETPVTKGVYTWEDFKEEYYYTNAGQPPLAKDGTERPFDASEWLGFDPDETEGVLAQAGRIGEALSEVVSQRTVSVNPELDEDAFFTTVEGRTTVVNRYDLEKAVPVEKKAHFRELDRYWVNKPYAFVVIFHSDKENETKYYLIEPHLNPIEKDLQEFLTGKLRDAIKYSDDDVVVKGGEHERRAVIERETRRLLDRYDLYESEGEGVLAKFKGVFSRGAGDDDSAGDADDEAVGPSAEEDSDAGEEDDEAGSPGVLGRITGVFSRSGGEGDDEATDEEEIIPKETPITIAPKPVRPEPIILEENSETIDEIQVVKLLYYLKRNFIGYERIDGIKHDINVEDISCDGYNSPVFVYHTDYEQIISNIHHGKQRLDDFVVKLAQRSGKGISKRRPQVDATLPDGSRAQLTLGREVSDHGTNYTIRQFKDVPFTPIDLINWKTFSLEEMAFLWLCIENNKSLIFAGGTASGKTTSLNAVSLFIPSNAKIVSIEDTREVELPQRNWIASVTRPSFTDDDKGDVDEFDLLEAALRQRPDYIVMGEIRGEEGRTLFQVMSTGHTTYTTFHADSVGEVLKRFTTDPINVSKTMFTALDLVSIQTSTRVQGNKVRRNKALTEINHYDPENDEINVKDIYQWQAETDEFLKMGDSNTLDEIKFDRGWNQETLDEEMFRRKIVLAYLIVHGLNEYRQVAATLQAFINDPDTIMTLIALDRLEESLEDLRTMESVLIDVDPEKEALVPRPDPDVETLALAKSILEHAEETVFEDYRDREVEPGSLSTLLANVASAEDVTVQPGDGSGPEAQAIADREVAGELEAGDVGETPPAEAVAQTATAEAASSAPDRESTPARGESTASSAGPSDGGADGDGDGDGQSTARDGEEATPPASGDAAEAEGGSTEAGETDDEGWVWKQIGAEDAGIDDLEEDIGPEETPDEETWSEITFGIDDEGETSAERTPSGPAGDPTADPSTDGADGGDANPPDAAEAPDAGDGSGEEDDDEGFGEFGEFESIVIGDEDQDDEAGGAEGDPETSSDDGDDHGTDGGEGASDGNREG